MKQFPISQTSGAAPVQGRNSWEYYDPHSALQQTPLPSSVKQVTPQGGMARILVGKGQGRPWLKWALLLALVLLLGALGSTQIFAGGGGGGRGIGFASPTATGRLASPPPTSTPKETPTSVPISPTPGTTPQASSGGQLGSLPPSWESSGRGDAEFVEAKDVAETFASHYELLDWRSRNTFDQATFAMTQAALAQRFLQRDERANPSFIAHFIARQEVLSPSLESEQTRVVETATRGNCFFAWMSVSFSLLHQEKNGSSYTDQHMLVVLLVNAQFGSNSVVGGVGWLVSDWREGGGIFTIPDQP